MSSDERRTSNVSGLRRLNARLVASNGACKRKIYEKQLARDSLDRVHRADSEPGSRIALGGSLSLSNAKHRVQEVGLRNHAIAPRWNPFLGLSATFTNRLREFFGLATSKTRTPRNTIRSTDLRLYFITP